MHGLIQGLEVTSADVHDSWVFGQLLYTGNTRVYADEEGETLTERACKYKSIHVAMKNLKT